MNPKRGYFFKVISIFFIIIICATVCTNVYTNNISSILNDNTKEHLQEVAEQAKYSLKVKFDAAIKELENLSNIISLQSGFNIEKSIKLLAEYEVRSSFYRIGIILPDGRGYSNTINGTNFSDREYFKKAIRGESNISEFMKDRTTGVLDSTFAVPVYDKNGNVMAVLAAAKPISEFEGLLDISIFNGKGFLYMVKGDGTVLVKQEHENSTYLINDLNEVPLGGSLTWEEVIKKGSSGIIKTKSEKLNEQYLAYVPVGINDWYILSVVPANIIDKNISNIIRNSILMWAFFAIVIIIIILYIIRSKEKSRIDLEKLAFYDEVTKGRNYNFFLYLYNEKVKVNDNKSYALVMLDIDKFKVINDVFGYEDGNKTLKYIYDTINKHINKDEILARINADNFLILLNYINDEDMTNRMGEIIDSINSGIDKELKSSTNRSSSYKVIVNYGICKIENRNESLDILCDKANLTKRTVKGTHQSTGAFYDKSLSDKIFKEKELENSMDRALKEKQFQVYFQPEVSFKTGKIIGAEALVRWNHSENGMIFPDEFIPLFEKNHFIKKLDFYMFNEVAEMIQKWEKEKDILLPEIISVNLSRVNLRDMDLPEKLVAIVNSHNVETNKIGIELTESSFFEDENSIIYMMERLKKEGFKIFIDDFGSGYSSLKTLKDLNVDYLKFDRGFLANLEVNKKGKDILYNLVNMARDINLNTVAEGVETIAQANFLREKGFDIAQGYYYYKPMTEDELLCKLKVGVKNEE